MRFRKKPVEIEAVQWTGENFHDVAKFCPTARWIGNGGVFSQLMIDTMEGSMHATVNDWIICGVKGEFYPCKPDIFAATYDAVESVPTH